MTWPFAKERPLKWISPPSSHVQFAIKIEKRKDEGPSVKQEHKVRNEGSLVRAYVRVCVYHRTPSK